MALKQSFRSISPQETFEVGVSFRNHGDLVHGAFAEALDKRDVESVLEVLNHTTFYFDPTGIKRRIGDSEFYEYTQSLSAPCSPAGFLNYQETNENAANEDVLSDFLDVDELSIIRTFATIKNNIDPIVFVAIYELIKTPNPAAHGEVKPEAVGWIDFRGGSLCSTLDTKVISEVSLPSLEDDGIKLTVNYAIVHDNAKVNPKVDQTENPPFVHPFQPQTPVRLYFMPEDKYPVPGEFMALAVTFLPGAIPVSQESTPIITSGEWVDTASYTGGIVESVEEDTEGDEGETYTIKYKGESIAGVKSTDYFVYSVGDRVAIIHAPDADLTSSDSANNADFTNVSYDDSKFIKIAPITFYEE